MCACGLYAFYEPAALKEFAVEGDVWGAVLAWGRVEIHEDGFRSQWQRPLALAAAPGTHGAREEEFARAASRYRAPLVAWEELEPIAREHGDPIPPRLVPIRPLALLSSRWSWRRLPPVEDELPDSTVRDLASSIARGSVLARHQLAGFAADLAFTAAYDPTADVDTVLRRLEVGLIGLLAAAGTWRPCAHAAPTAADERWFRGHAAAWIERALQAERADWELSPPTALTWGRIHELTHALPDPSIQSELGRPRPTSPLDEQQVLFLLSILASREPATRDLVSELWLRLQHLRPGPPKDGWWRTGAARRLFASGSRSPAVIGSVMFSDHFARRPEKQRALLRAIANDPETAPITRAEALEELAANGPLEASLTWLEHPCASVWSSSDALAKHGAAGKAAARAMLTHPCSDAQLCACIAALGPEAATAARQRLSRPVPPQPLLRQCIKALPPDEAAELITARVRTGEAVANGEWWAAVSELPNTLQEPIACTLLARIHRIAPDDRFFKLEQALSCAAWTTQPHNGPTTLEQQIRDYVLGADDLYEEDREWLLTNHAH